MRPTQIFGAFLVALPFILIAAVCIHFEGWLVFGLTFGGAAAICCTIFGGICLMEG